MDEIDRVQQAMIERQTEPSARGQYYPDTFPFTDATPCVVGPEEIACGKRGSPDGRRVFYRCECGALLNLGRPHPDDRSLDDVTHFECCRCGRSSVT